MPSRPNAISTRSSHSAARSAARTLLTVRQTARRLGCAAATVERLARSGAFAGARRARDGAWLIPSRAVAARQTNGRQEPHRVVPSDLVREVEEHRKDSPAGAMARPRTRAECQGAPRPCPFVGCRFNLFLDVCGSGSLVMNAGGEPQERDSACSCALDIAEREALPVDRVAELLGSTRARVRQIEERALRKLSVGLGGGDDPEALLAAVDALDRRSAGEEAERIGASELEDLHPLCATLHIDPATVPGAVIFLRRRA